MILYASVISVIISRIVKISFRLHRPTLFTKRYVLHTFFLFVTKCKHIDITHSHMQPWVWFLRCTGLIDNRFLPKKIQQRAKQIIDTDDVLSFVALQDLRASLHVKVC